MDRGQLPFGALRRGFSRLAFSRQAFSRQAFSRLLRLALGLGLLLALSPPAAARNFHLIDSLPNGFAIYRSGAPDSSDIAEYCRLGIREIAVLSGNAKRYEGRYRDTCSDLEVVYDEKQRSSEPLSIEFLEWFDDWVDEAREEGKKIAIRCNCGCHRTGRLAAYYQMKYQNLSLEEALAIMVKRGKNWWKHPHLTPQVRALKDYIDGKRCSQAAEHCLREDSES